MKKIITITALLLFVTSSAFAATLSIPIPDTLTKDASGKTLYGTSDATTAVSTSSPLIGKTSTGVALGILVVAGGTGYSLVTQHLNGTKAYGSSYDSTSIYSKDVTTVGEPILTVPTAIDTTDFTSWNPL